MPFEWLRKSLDEEERRRQDELARQKRAAESREADIQQLRKTTSQYVREARIEWLIGQLAKAVRTRIKVKTSWSGANYQISADWGWSHQAIFVVLPNGSITIGFSSTYEHPYEEWRGGKRLEDMIYTAYQEAMEPSTTDEGTG